MSCAFTRGSHPPPNRDGQPPSSSRAIQTQCGGGARGRDRAEADGPSRRADLPGQEAQEFLQEATGERVPGATPSDRTHARPEVFRTRGTPSAAAGTFHQPEPGEGRQGAAAPGERARPLPASWWCYSAPSATASRSSYFRASGEGAEPPARARQLRPRPGCCARSLGHPRPKPPRRSRRSRRSALPAARPAGARGTRAQEPGAQLPAARVARSLRGAAGRGRGVEEAGERVGARRYLTLWRKAG